MNQSRQSKIEERKNLRRAVLLGLVAIILLFGLVVFGIPTLVKFSAFLAELKSSSNPIQKEDTVPPAPPNLINIPEFTNQESLKISGVAEPGTKVSLFKDANEVDSTLSDKNGDFAFDITLEVGENSFWASAEDQSGNKSAESEKVKVVLDKEEPQLEISEPSDGQQFSGTSERQIILKGKSQDALSVWVNDRVVVLDSGYNFSYATSLSEGANTFSVKSTDKAGNMIEKQLTVSYTP